jgi:hypothetical protein
VTDTTRTCLVASCFSDPSEARTGRVVYVDSLKDVAIVHTDRAGVPLLLAEEDAEIGAPVYTIGNPKGYLASLSTGVVSQLRADRECERGLVQCTSTIGPGSSGGPMLNGRGEVIGMTSFVDGDDDSFYAFGVDAETLRGALISFDIAFDNCRDGSPPALVLADTTRWAGLSISPAERTPVWDPEPTPAQTICLWIAGWSFAVGPIVLCLAGLGAVLVRRKRRLSRNVRRSRMRRSFEELRDRAFIPQEIVEGECSRA